MEWTRGRGGRFGARDLITLNDDGLIQDFEVVMRPHKTIGALREAMNARVKTDPRFLKFRDALS